MEVHNYYKDAKENMQLSRLLYTIHVSLN